MIIRISFKFHWTKKKTWQRPTLFPRKRRNSSHKSLKKDTLHGRLGFLRIPYLMGAFKLGLNFFIVYKWVFLDRECTFSTTISKIGILEKFTGIFGKHCWSRWRNIGQMVHILHLFLLKLNFASKVNSTAHLSLIWMGYHRWHTINKINYVTYGFKSVIWMSLVTFNFQ